jgi:acetyltransferase
MADVDFGDMLDYLTADPYTRAIQLYAEGITHGRTFMSAARAAARINPVLVLKADRSPRARGATPHTGMLRAPMPPTTPTALLKEEWETIARALLGS